VGLSFFVYLLRLKNIIALASFHQEFELTSFQCQLKGPKFDKNNKSYAEWYINMEYAFRTFQRFFFYFEWLMGLQFSIKTLQTDWLSEWNNIFLPCHWFPHKYTDKAMGINSKYAISFKIFPCSHSEGQFKHALRNWHHWRIFFRHQFQRHFGSF
jgi:hypothetical protein